MTYHPPMAFRRFVALCALVGAGLGVVVEGGLLLVGARRSSRGDSVQSLGCRNSVGRKCQKGLHRRQ